MGGTPVLNIGRLCLTQSRGFGFCAAANGKSCRQAEKAPMATPGHEPRPPGNQLISKDILKTSELARRLLMEGMSFNARGRPC
jgi:hypothetical protein